MFFEGNRQTFARLQQKRDLLAAGDARHEEIRPALLVLSGLMCGVDAGGKIAALHAHNLMHSFDYAFGISSGIPTTLYGAAGQIKEGVSVYWNECVTPAFLSLRRALTNDFAMDIDFLASVFRGETPRKLRLDQDAVRRSRTACYAGVTCANTGEGIFLDVKKTDMVEAMRASIAAPGLSHANVVIDGRRYMDGDGGFPFPAREIIERYRPTDLLVLTNRGHDAPSEGLSRLLPLVSGSFTRAVQKVFETRAERFAEGLSYLRNQTACNWAISWSDNIRTLERNPVTLERTARNAEREFDVLLA